MDVLTRFLPNVVERWSEFVPSVGETLYMTGLSGLLSFVLGLVFGIMLVVTKEGGVLENKPLFRLNDTLTNLFRSVPFIILLVALMPLTRFVLGSAIGTKGVIIPLVFGTTPFFSRQVEAALEQLDPGLIEAAQSMGNSPWQIIAHVYLRESVGGLIRAVTITLVSLIGLTTMAGVIGGGGIGDFAIRYGYQKSYLDITYLCVVVLLVLVNIITVIGEWGIKKNTH